MVDLTTLRADFVREYGSEPRIFSAPGRVNLIGEHTDYNEGFVLPLAIEQRTYVAAAPGLEGRIRARSLDVAGAHSFELRAQGQPLRGKWFDYVEGTARALVARGAHLAGSDLLIQSDVPSGAGLSSSAALEVAVGNALLALAQLPIDKSELALASQAAEHTYVGTLCGIMDQYVVALAKPDHALLIDCRSRQTVDIPIDFAAMCLVVCDSGVKHSLATSEYNTRRSQCDMASSLIQKALPLIRSLRDVNTGQLEVCEKILPDVLWRRCRHVVTENARTTAATYLLRAGQMAAVGALMNASHKSLRDDYEVSCAELDMLVDAARAAGALGARMTGGGFGGCTVSLVRREHLEKVTQALTRKFRLRFGTSPRIFVTRASGGVREEQFERP